MSRANAVYVAMFVALIIGLWGILRVGGRLRAPHDLSGNWEIEQPVRDDGDAGTGTDQGADGVPGEVLSVEQSGRYFRLRFDGGAPIDLKLAEEARIPDEPGGAVTRMRMTGETADVQAQAGPDAGLLRVRLRWRDRDWHFDAWSPQRVADAPPAAPGAPASAPATRTAAAATTGRAAPRPALVPGGDDDQNDHAS